MSDVISTENHAHTDECWEPDSGCDMGRNEKFAVRVPRDEVDGGLAFPSSSAIARSGSGLTKRELIAAMAMQGCLGGEPGSHLQPAKLAAYSVEYADALLKELAR